MGDSSTSNPSSEDQEWFVPCDDEAVYAETGLARGQLTPGAWRPDPKEVLALYGGLEAMGGVLPLRWGWAAAGRRPPTPGEDEEYETDEDESGAAAGGAAGGAAGAGGASDAAQGSGFDFDDDEMSSSSSTPGRMRRPGLGGQRELKGSAKKKTTEFRNVLSNMQRHRQMDAARAKQQQQQQQQQQQKTDK